MACFVVLDISARQDELLREESVGILQVRSRSGVLQAGAGFRRGLLSWKDGRWAKEVRH